MSIELLLNIEDRLLKEELDKNDLASFETIDSQIIKVAHKEVHSALINELVARYVSFRFPEFSSLLFSDYFEGSLKERKILREEDVVNENIPEICERLHISYLNSSIVINKKGLSRKKSKENLIENGAVYTQDAIAYSIVQRTLEKIDDIAGSRILDFATGTGRFYRQLAICLKNEHGISYNSSILTNLYAIDIDPVAVNICRLLALSLIDKIDKETLGIISRHIVCKNALIKNILYDKYSLLPDDLDSLHLGKFDAIVSNPPYLVLKPNKRKMDVQTVATINNMSKYFRTSQDYQYSIEGMLNLYQLSLETMINMLKGNGQMGIICPSTLFADISASKLRKYLLKKHNVYYIKYFSEDDPLFENVTQATCIFHLTKGVPTSNISIISGGKKFKISINDVKLVFGSNWEIPSIGKIEWDILRKLLVVPLMKNLSYIRNKRGELDLSLYRDYITMERTKYRLIRGNMISGNAINDINHEYVKPEFLEKKSNDYLTNDHGKRRLICQQISNQTQNVRLKFVECQKNDILGNSCNYITVDDNLIPKMKVILNSALLNWRFKVTSTNNHINNYELDELPIIDPGLITADILQLEELKRDEIICSLYGLKGDEIKYIIRQQYEAL